MLVCMLVEGTLFMLQVEAEKLLFHHYQMRIIMQDMLQQEEYSIKNKMKFKIILNFFES